MKALIDLGSSCNSLLPVNLQSFLIDGHFHDGKLVRLPVAVPKVATVAAPKVETIGATTGATIDAITEAVTLIPVLRFKVHSNLSFIRLNSHNSAQEVL